MNAVPPSGPRHRRWPWIASVMVIAAAVAAWWWFGASKSQEAKGASRTSAPVVVVTTKAESRDVPVRLKANGTVTALQSTDLRAQVTSTVRDVHIREGQSVQGRAPFLPRCARRGSEPAQGRGADREGQGRPFHRQAQPRAPARALP